MLEINNQTKRKIDLKKTSALVEAFLRIQKKSAWSLSLALVGPARIKQLNRDYRGFDKATDILSFVNEPSVNNQGKYLGDLVLNLAEVAKTSKYKAMLEEIDLDYKKYGQKPRAGRGDNYIFYFLLVHGLLHLVGYDDATECGRLEMMQRGKAFLKKVL